MSFLAISVGILCAISDIAVSCNSCMYKVLKIIGKNKQEFQAKCNHKSKNQAKGDIYYLLIFMLQFKMSHLIYKNNSFKFMGPL